MTQGDGVETLTGTADPAKGTIYPDALGPVPDVFISATQINMYRACQRQYGWRYLAGIKTAPTEAQLLGTETDDTQWQPYLRDGRPFDLTRRSGHIAQALQLHLPQPKTVQVQREFRLPAPDGYSGFIFIGYIDIWAADSAIVPRPEGVTVWGGRPFVGDTKTTKDFKYCKDLRDDVQAMLYATYALVATGESEVDLAWLYSRTDPKKPHKPKVVPFRAGEPHVVEQFKSICDTAQEIVRLRVLNPPVLSLPPNPDHCNAFGRPCEYSDKCNLSPTEIRAARSARGKGETMDPEVMKRLAAKRAAQAGQTGTTDPAKGTCNPSPPAPAAAVAVPAPSSSPPIVMSDRDVPPASEIPRAFLSKEPYKGINPPESKLPPPASDKGVSTAVTAPSVAPVAEGAVDAATAQAAPEPPADITPTKRKPGRPKKTAEPPVDADAPIPYAPTPKAEDDAQVMLIGATRSFQAFLTTVARACDELAKAIGASK